MEVAAPVTINGVVNVVDDSASLFGKGENMPGLCHLFNNSVFFGTTSAALGGGRWPDKDEAKEVVAIACSGGQRFKPTAR